MRRTVAVATALFLFVPGAHADEIGGGGFSVPQNEWLWGIEGLTRTPVDLAANIGGSWYDYEVNATLKHFDNSPGFGSDSEKFKIERPGSIQAGFRVAGGLGYWACCVTVEPAMAFWWNRPLGSGKSDRGPTVFDPDDGTGDEFTHSRLEVMETWDLAFGPQITFMIRDTTPLLGSHLGLEGLPFVFFPFMGVSQSKWDVEFSGFDDGAATGNAVKNYEDDFFLIGFDIDVPLPGSHAAFTHNLTFGFKWVDTDERHDMTVGVTNAGNTQTLHIRESEGYRLELRYQVTWNDFEGFVKRNFFGPVN